LSALMAWLDARSRGDGFVLRLEDNDHTRLRPGFADGLRRDLAWLGLDWDQCVVQSNKRHAHELALDRLGAQGLLYPCTCSRARRQASGRTSPDGGFAYDNLCRERSLPRGGWREAEAAVRMRLDDGAVALIDEGGLDLSQRPAIDLGDPIVVRRDGVLAYHLVVVVDDAESDITRVVRGRDIAPLTATHVLMQQVLGVSQPTYRHHFLLLEESGDKLAKLHGSISIDELRARYDGPGLCGALAAAAGLRSSAAPVTPADLLADFDWARVRKGDLFATW
jgi:glutamyl/glutaminyl-tRNA synthetase